MKGHSVIFDSKDGPRYRIEGGQGEIMVTSEAYTRPEDAERGVVDLYRAVAEDIGATEQFRKWLRDTAG